MDPWSCGNALQKNKVKSYQRTITPTLMRKVSSYTFFYMQFLWLEKVKSVYRVFKTFYISGFTNWLQICLPKMPANSMLVFDNAPYHSKKVCIAFFFLTLNWVLLSTNVAAFQPFYAWIYARRDFSSFCPDIGFDEESLSFNSNTEPLWLLALLKIESSHLCSAECLRST